MGQDRYAFGANWQRFLDRGLTDEQVASATSALREWVGDLTGRSFLDIGCGSGIHSLAAVELGASLVRSFDYDPDSVEACKSIQATRPTERWVPVERGDILDSKFVDALGTWDVVYSWGVLHHTGAMWEACSNAAKLVASGGTLFIALYNDAGRSTDRWTRVKSRFNRSPWLVQRLIVVVSAIRLWGPTLLRDLVSLHPRRTLHEARARGMAPWVDVEDWVGGWPYENAKPEEVFEKFHSLGFALDRMVTVPGLGCNEYLFVRDRGPTETSPT